ncbi:SDR family NAD(P)-dependent oxidoreductase [Phycisphaera mikurensis]|uniref:Putative oxidoreductase n=1 Tax=Phycisphaera mikurensis (strain NBRC 102666 / KCTC 22515 / FYK2301M01) TaxID=1142394 RepID=I0IBU4_PHYMF|nr:SDR family oxidoreductase [Phycisphaera mikurensis]MBB6442040.1 NAD(P)-dependent dehydrogenase (short-subunit alcohol dehydrogenase family) [Phycisphaera mikurensis]BAM02732.1 putative oxidoreductase [Phycisphaera mikurensis NBRC 102666]
MPQTSSLFDLSGRVALVSGGTSGIGLAIAEAFVDHGAKVVVGSRTADKVKEAVDRLNDRVAESAAGAVLDVQSEDSVRGAFDHGVRRFGTVNDAVHSAGVMHKADSAELEAEPFNRLYDIHVTGGLRLAKALAAHLASSGASQPDAAAPVEPAGSFTFIASITSFAALSGVTAYAAAKSAQMGLIRNLSTDFGARGIRVNGIAPGFVPTDLNRKMITGTDRGRRILERTPMARFGTADEIAGAAVYLAAPAGAFVNGHTIVVDGGFLACGLGDAVAPWS